MNTIKAILLIALFTLPFLLSAQQWRQVYENDGTGTSISGSKADLLAAINSGSEVRIGWRIYKEGKEEEFIEHFSTADQVDIVKENDVYAQISVPRQHDYRARKEEMSLEEFSGSYLFSTKDCQMSNILAGTRSVMLDIKQMVNIRWFVR